LHWRTADTRLRQALAAAGLVNVPSWYRTVDTPQQAQQLGVRGSPTILVDGHDLFATGEAPAGRSCRVYQTERARTVRQASSSRGRCSPDEQHENRTTKEPSVPTVIDRDQLRRLLKQESGQLVEVPPRAEYDHEHLPGAISLPLKQLNAATAAALDRTRPVITYCHDGL
jgi:hypothetical protein